MASTEYDPRMTEETKDFSARNVEGFSKLYPDIILFRKTMDTADEENNKNERFDSITEKEFFVDSIYDQYKIPVSAYIPKNFSPKAPIVVYFHGGGFRFASRKTYRRPLCYIVEKTNTIFISVEYRLSPEYKYPTPLQDCLSVAKWVLKNKTNFLNVAEDAKVGVGGDSAGGNAAVYVTHELRNQISFQILIYPWLNLTGSSYRHEFLPPQYILSKEVIDITVNDYVNDRSILSNPGVSPLFNDNLTRLPKCLFVNAELDPLLGDAIAYFKKLQEAGVESELYIVKGAIHCLFHAYFDYKNAYLEAANKIISYINSL